jgi:hypothetical protein
MTTPTTAQELSSALLQVNAAIKRMYDENINSTPLWADLNELRCTLIQARRKLGMKDNEVL